MRATEPQNLRAQIADLRRAVAQRDAIHTIREATAPKGPPFDGQSWEGGIHENTYIKEDGAWKTRDLTCDILWQAGFDEGWGRAMNRLPSRDKADPEDSYGPELFVGHGTEMWPQRTAPLPFHFAHTATREPIIDRLPVGQARLPDLQ